jgi:hypothetical protein
MKNSYLKKDGRNIAHKACEALSVQTGKAGGPRDGSGGALTRLRCAATNGRKACAKAEGLVGNTRGVLSGALMAAHKPQSMQCIGCGASGLSGFWLSAWSSNTNFMPPVLVHTSVPDCAYNTGETKAANKAHNTHSNTPRTRVLGVAVYVVERRVGLIKRG